MTQIQSKKKFAKKSRITSLSNICVDVFLTDYKNVFIVHRRDNSQTAKNYIEGLLICEKGHANMERIEEEIIDSEYSAYQHFISNSKWDHQELISRISLDVSNILNETKKKSGFPTGYIIDESSHLKKVKNQ